MKKFHFSDTSLFWGFSEEEAESVLKCLSAVNKTYKKDEYIFRMGDTITSVGMVLTGSVQVIREDYWGNGSTSRLPRWNTTARLSPWSLRSMTRTDSPASSSRTRWR